MPGEPAYRLPVEDAELDATHALIYEQPELISSQIARFLAAQS